MLVLNAISLELAVMNELMHKLETKVDATTCNNADASELLCVAKMLSTWRDSCGALGEAPKQQRMKQEDTSCFAAPNEANEITEGLIIPKRTFTRLPTMF